MREINIGGKEIRIKATPLVLLFYKKEFNSDLVGDMAGFDGIETDKSKMNSLVLLQSAWAMSKAANLGSGNVFPSFEKWLGSFDDIDFSDETFLRAVMEEAADGFFRGATKKQIGTGK